MVALPFGKKCIQAIISNLVFQEKPGFIKKAEGLTYTWIALGRCKGGRSTINIPPAHCKIEVRRRRHTHCLRCEKHKEQGGTVTDGSYQGCAGATSNRK